LWQAHLVANLLLLAEIKAEVLAFDLAGDKGTGKNGSKIATETVLDDPLTKELVEIWVQDARDLHPNLMTKPNVLAFCKREQPHDVILSFNKYFTLEDESQKLVLAAPSPLKVALIRRHFPKVKAIEMTGGLPAQLRKMEDGNCDALIVAYAEVLALGYAHLIVKHLSTDFFPPTLGQGGIAVRIAEHLPPEMQARVKQAVNDDEAELAIRTEHTVANYIYESLTQPYFVFAEKAPDEQVLIRAGFLFPNGKEMVTLTKTGPILQAEEVAKEMANELSSQYLHLPTKTNKR
jgi:hydroxymethylbilane synthase